jgi:phosphoglycolate phosphatase
MIDGVIFDKDGTLFDFDATWGVWVRRFLLELTHGDADRAANLGTVVGYNFAEKRFIVDSVVIAGTPVEIAQSLLPHLGDTTLDDLLARMNQMAIEAPQVPVVPLAHFVQRLKDRGLRIGVATNDAKAPAIAHLTAAGVAQHFDFIAGSDSGYGGKPAAGQLLAFCAAQKVDPKRCAMVGDSTHDLHAAKAAGMWRIAVLTGVASHDDLVAHADVVLPDIGALPDWIDAQRLLGHSPTT